MKLSRELKTGIIVIGGILLFILGFSYLKATPLFDNSKTFYAVYDDVGGLQPGTQVSINGFSVGKVNDIRFKDKTGKLMVTFTVDSDFQFSKNSIAELYDTGIIGGKGIQIIPVFDNAKMAESGDTLVTKTKPGLTDLVQQNLAPLQTKVEGAISNADSLLINVNDVLDAKTKKDLQSSIAGLNDLIKSFKVTTNSLNSLMANNKEDLESSLANIKKITDDFAKISTSLSEAELDKSIAGLQKTVANLDNLLTKIDKGEGSLGKLMNNEELYNNLAGASKELDLLLQDFRLNPKRYVNVSVFGKKQKEYTLPENDPADTLKN
ncbi:MlaD family protein [Cellulophaga lytica]|uniref:Mammalian cell entry related domain protein n=1 Tax=Cellulophaga lytica (strain ATCC 23178 / DSM 7489 / JCM 8516 / NBRC 14961 / NCIMB 1423 / VKM B-1433 / Cy l20) TaxID=867900 RepID=F0R9S5_CELLC|nr:MlaD family protein [Cellulophaga lytica]ADY30420.1 Mammalian cell entry related domain protein [Cellulophaga lytica DSM 7489]AIM61408.1 ABC transporter substrate-binding protein [Cellulophaga lytica]WQG78648.1 MlaD family protein [Cellulophaga lytica]